MSLTSSSGRVGVRRGQGEGGGVDDAGIARVTEVTRAATAAHPRGTAGAAILRLAASPPSVCDKSIGYVLSPLHSSKVKLSMGR